MVLVLGANLFVVVPAVAQQDDPTYGLNTAATKANYTANGSNSISSWVQIGVSALLGILSIVFFGLTVYAGVIWMTARGNDEKASEARSTIEAAVVGLVLVLAAYAITQFVFGKLGR